MSAMDNHPPIENDNHADSAMEAETLVPLPADFNPDQKNPSLPVAGNGAGVSPLIEPAIPQEKIVDVQGAETTSILIDPNEDDLESLNGDLLPTVSTPEATTKDVSEEIEVDAGEGEEDREKLREILQSLQGQRGEEEDEGEEEKDDVMEEVQANTVVESAVTTPSSRLTPLSPLPGLPAVLHLSPIPEPPRSVPPLPTIPMLPPSKSPRSLDRIYPDANSTSDTPSGTASRDTPAESSTRAQRNTESSPQPKSMKRPRASKKGKTMADEDGDTLGSLSEGDSASNVEGVSSTAKKRKKRTKKTRDPDAKPFRTSAKSRTLLDQVLGIPRSSSIPNLPEKTPVRARAMNDASIKQFLLGKDREVQLSTCQKTRYAAWGKCTQCISKLGGDTCRFISYRTFKIDPETTEIVEPGWFESTELKEEITPLPRDFNVPFQEEHMVRIEKTVAPMLAPMITREIRHVVQKKSITRGVDSARHRSVCDFCASTIFAGYFFCKRCGKDYCLTCERYFSTSLDTIGSSPWTLPDAARPRLLRCVAVGKSGKGGKNWHFRGDLQAVSRFGVGELGEHWERLAEFVLNEGKGSGKGKRRSGGGGIEDERERLGLLGLGDVGEDIVMAVKQGRSESVIDPELQDTGDSTGKTNGSVEEIATLYTKITNPKAIPIPDPARLEEKSREFMFVKMDELDNERFDRLWGRGEPIVVDGVGEKMKMSWGPDDFIERFGHEVCSVMDCTTSAMQSRTVKSFFETFKNSEDRGGAILKVKDWPTTDDFRNTHPALYNDFCDALPVPDYTRREGVLNLYSHFPPGVTRPDIGPKMYNAFKAVETRGGFGSTRLHMDVADAVNVMLYASPRSPPSDQRLTADLHPDPDDDPATLASSPEPGCAVWDLYRAEDAPLMRSFLTSKFGHREKFTDPIHSQLFYLDAALRRELFERTGVVGWRIYQYPGQAVFIPAGCAHQVCNLADCIKIALDFVSPHNVGRCKELTQDFRAENFVIAWKEDVLQLYNVLWYAWLNCQETRARRQGEAKTKDEEDAARAARLESLQNGVDPDASLIASNSSTNGMSLSSIVSSVRDQTPQPQPQPQPQPDPSTSLPLEPLQSPPTRPIDTLAPLPHDPSETPAPTLKLTQMLLQATLKLEEPAPAPEARTPSVATNWGVGAITRLNPPKPKKTVVNKDKSRGAVVGDGDITGGEVSIGKLVREKHWPLDLAVSAARLQMGEGGDIEEFMKSTEAGEGRMEVDEV